MIKNENQNKKQNKQQNKQQNKEIQIKKPNIINTIETKNKKNKLINQQIQNTKQLNNLLNSANNIINCGPECQRNKILDDLRVKFLNAETNLKTAPTLYENSRKNYYVFKEGSSYYNDLLEKELTEKANNNSIQIQNEFNQQIYNANSLNKIYENNIINSNTNFEYYNILLNKNKELLKIIKESKNNILVNDRKTYYEVNEYEKLQNRYYYFKLFYYILLLIFLISIFLIENKFSKIRLILLFILLIFFPYLISILIILIKKIYYFIKKRIPINVYNNI